MLVTVKCVLRVFREDLSDRGMSRDFVEQARHLFLHTGGNKTEYPMLGERGFENVF